MEKSGAWYSFGGERIGQGRESAKEFLRQHPDTTKELSSRIMEKAGIKTPHEEPQPLEKKEKIRGK
jgi:recombination protein RecA